MTAEVEKSVTVQPPVEELTLQMAKAVGEELKKHQDATLTLFSIRQVKNLRL